MVSTLDPKEASEKAVALLREIRTLLELHGENPFKVRAYEKAVDVLSGREDLVKRAQEKTLTEMSGIGKGISEILEAFLLRGDTQARDELAKGLPPGLTELIQVPGLGPKKARTLIDELGIQTLAELEYACRENRLLNLKGFGEKMQSRVLEGIQFLKSNQSRTRLVDALPLSAQLRDRLQKALGKEANIEETGALRRRLEVLEKIEFLITAAPSKTSSLKKISEKALAEFQKSQASAIPVELYWTEPSEKGKAWAETTGSSDFLEAFGSKGGGDHAETEEAFFKALRTEWVSPEMRETSETAELAKKGSLKQVLAVDGIRGVFHNHTTRSDGTASLRQMVTHAKKLGYSYIGISDHSQSAFYAQGLKADELKEQEKEIRDLQDEMPEIKIFWGVESDILQDGSLDYPESVLKRMDFVVASIHSRFKMDRAQMTERVIRAIRNPYTRFVGHLTGRLLLGRPGYELDMEAVIEEAAKHDVAIEINANPARLDIDWRHGGLLRAHKTKVSVNPDAHSTEGLEDTVFGIWMARKALLPSSLVVNSWDTQEITKWLDRK